MERWLQRQMRRASLKRLLAALVLLAAHGWWTFASQSPWTKPFGVLGNEMPELIAGFPDGEPAAAIASLSDARGDYLWFQAFDLPFVALAGIAGVTAIALGLKRLDLARGDGRFLLLAPALYVAFELSENTLLALFAAGAADPTGVLALAQQIATVGKFASAVLSTIFAAACLGAWGAFALARSVRRAR